MNFIKYSIVIPTINRTEELRALLLTIKEQEYQNIEIIVVDQNGDNRLEEVIKESSAYIPITHLRVSFRGASKARNYGAAKASGDILFFPDDDAEILPGFFVNADVIFDSQPNVKVVFGKCVDREGVDSVLKFSSKSGRLSKTKHKGMFVEATMLIYKNIFLENLFDEGLGVGTFHGAEEAYDLVIRLMNKDCFLFYTPDLKIYHPNKIKLHSDPSEISRVFSYRCGFSKLCIKHRLYWRLFHRVTLVCVYIPFLLIIDRRRVRYYFSELLGLMAGVIIK